MSSCIAYSFGFHSLFVYSLLFVVFIAYGSGILSLSWAYDLFFFSERGYGLYLFVLGVVCIVDDVNKRISFE